MSGLSQIKLTESCVPCITFSTPVNGNSNHGKTVEAQW